MVLRGAQFQRSKPARCRLLTRRALSSYRVTFVQRRADAECLPHASRMTVWRWLDPYGTSLCGELHGENCVIRKG